MAKAVEKKSIKTNQSSLALLGDLASQNQKKTETKKPNLAVSTKTTEPKTKNKEKEEVKKEVKIEKKETAPKEVVKPETKAVVEKKEDTKEVKKKTTNSKQNLKDIITNGSKATDVQMNFRIDKNTKLLIDHVSTITGISNKEIVLKGLSLLIDTLPEDNITLLSILMEKTTNN